MTEAIRDAMAQGGIQPEDIDYINAHGSGTKQNDRHETAAYKQGARRPRLQDPDQLDQVDDRPLARRDRGDRDGRLRAGDRPRRGPADRELGEPATPSATSTTRRVEARQKTMHTALSTGQRVRRLPVGDDRLAARGAAGGRRHESEPSIERPEPGFAERPFVTLPDTARRAVFTGIGVVAPNGADTDSWWEATKAGKSGIDRITRFDPSRYDTQLAGEVEGFDVDDLHREAASGADRPLDPHGAGRHADGVRRRRASSPSEQDPYSMSVDHRQLELRRQRVRPEGDPGAVGEGPGLRRRLSVDRLVLRGDYRPDLDQARHEGPLRRRRLPRARAAWRRCSTRAGRSAAASSTWSAAGSRRRSAPTRSPARCDTGLPQPRARPGRRLPARSTRGRTATCPARAARS